MGKSSRQREHGKWTGKDPCQTEVCVSANICSYQKGTDKFLLIKNDHLLLLAQKRSSTSFVGILHLDEDNENASISNSCL